MLDHIHQAQTYEDSEIAYNMAMKFAINSPYKDYVDPEVINQTIKGLMQSPDAVILLCGDAGMIAMSILPFIYGTDKVAVEMAWWVEPKHRMSRVGEALLNAAEGWAKFKGAKAVTMISLDDDIGKYYEKRGYTLREHTYMKEL